MIGKLLGGHYRVVEILATGGFGQTYIARDTHRPGNPKCVVKHLKPATSEPSFLQNARRLFQSEAESLEKLGNNDQIPRLLAHFEENQEFYLVQEFIEGHPLSAELQPGQIWTETQVVELLQEVLGILEFVHSYGLIHRDIKPSNLIRRHQDGRLVLIDFGSVKQAWTQMVTEQGKICPSFTIFTSATIAIGTPGYIPTEQARGKPRPNSDIYALGMIGIQALTGLHPTQLQEDSDTDETLWQHQAQVSNGLASVLTKMVRYHFKDRYQVATEVLQALQLLANSHLPTKLKFDARVSPVQQPSMPLTTVFSGQPAQNQLSSQNTIPVSLANPSGTLVNSQTKSNSAGIYPDQSRLPTATSISAPQTTIIWPLEEQASSTTQKVIPVADPANSFVTGMDLTKKYPSVPATRKQYHLLIGAGITAALISLIASYAIYWQPRTSIGKTLDQVETLKAEGKYEDCVAQATTIPQNSSFYTNAQSLVHECQLAKARRLAAERNFKAAINEASKISQDAASYQEAATLIELWSNSILETATNQYQSGNLNDAVAIAEAIPKTSAVYQKAQGAIKQWNVEWDKNSSYMKAAQKAVDEGKWQNATNEAKKVVNTPYWKDKIEPIIQKAESKIAEAKTAATRQPIRTTTRPTRTATSRRITRTATRQPTRTATKTPTRITTSRRITRTVTRQPTRSAFPKPSSKWTVETR